MSIESIEKFIKSYGQKELAIIVSTYFKSFKCIDSEQLASKVCYPGTFLLFLFAILIVISVPFEDPSQNANTSSEALTISKFLIAPARFPYNFQSGLVILVSILFSLANLSAKLSAPIAPPDIIKSILL